jgi:hypothetical protein
MRSRIVSRPPYLEPGTAGRRQPCGLEANELGFFIYRPYLMKSSPLSPLRCAPPGTSSGGYCDARTIPGRHDEEQCDRRRRRRLFVRQFGTDLHIERGSDHTPDSALVG